MKRNLRLELFTVDNRYGVQLLPTEKRMRWDKDGDGHTETAKLTEVIEGVNRASFELSGDEWRDVEDTGVIDEIADSVRNGRSLANCLRRFEVDAQEVT